MGESWKPVEGFDGYEVSDLGRVRCWRAVGFSAPPMEPRILKPKGINHRKRYLSVNLGYKGPTKEIHRLVGEIFVPGRSPGLEVAHLNGNRHDNRAENLRWKTTAANHADKRRHGTNGRKLSEESVRQVRELYAHGGITQTEVGSMFGITQGTVGKIVRNELWPAA